MDTEDFLGHILPTGGHYAMAIIKDKRVIHKFFTDIPTMATAILETGGEPKPYNVYFAVASFGEEPSRTQSNVVAIKALFADVDCGPDKEYADWKAGLFALQLYLAASGMPMPLVVHSGRGLHLYWVLQRDLSKAEWQPLADSLKESFAKHGFKADPAVTADAARILRPIGTYNAKNGKEVRLLGSVPAYVAPEYLANKLSGAVTIDLKVNAVPPIPASMKARTSVVGSLAPTPTYAPSDPEELASKCKQIAWMVTNQDKVTEPQWHGLSGIAAYCVDPDATMVAWSNKHPDFNEAEALSKMHRWKEKSTGPTTCQRMEILRPNGCRGCTFKARITTPASLSQVYAAAPDPAQYDDVEAPPPVSDPSLMEVPFPFLRTPDNKIVANIDGVHVNVCDFRIYPTRYGRDDGLGYETVSFTWDRPNAGWQDITVRQAHLNHKNPEFGTSIADQGILLNGTTYKVETFQMLLRAYADQLRRRTSMTNLYTTNGWKNEFGEFVIGNNIIKLQKDKTTRTDPITMGRATHNMGDKMWIKSGSMEEWTKFTQIFDSGFMPTAAFVLLVSLGNPLYGYSRGIRGLTMNLFSPESGTGKTLTQTIAQSAWGDPSTLHISGSFTQPSLYNRLAVSGNLPVTIDEGTTIDNKNIPNMIYSISQGVDKLRLTRSANEAELKTWGTTMIVSSNKSFANILSVGGGNAAQEARLLEFYMPHNPLLADSTGIGRKMYQSMFKHHGHAGHRMVEIYMHLGYDAMCDLIEATRATFSDKYGYRFAGADRFVEQSFIQAEIAGQLAKKYGVIAFDPDVVIRHALRQLSLTAVNSVALKRDCFDHIIEYMNERKANTVNVYYHNNIAVQDNTVQPKGAIYVRLELTRDAPHATLFNRGIAYLDQVDFRRWLLEKNYDWKAISDELVKENADRTPPSKRLSLGRHTAYKTAQVYVLGVDLTHDRMVDILRNEDTARHDTALLTKLAVVK